MKKIYTLLAGLLFAGTLAAQLEYGIDTLELLHPMPTTEDSIRVKTLVTLPTINTLIARSDTVIDDTVKIDLFYCGGLLLTIDKKRDTTNVGLLPAGDYQLIVNAYEMGPDWDNDNMDTCIIYGVYADTISFRVDLVDQVFEAETTPLRMYPNPATQQFFIESETAIRSVTIYTVDGKMLQHNNYPDHPRQVRVDLAAKIPPGICLVKTSLKNGDIIAQKIIIQ